MLTLSQKAQQMMPYDKAQILETELKSVLKDMVTKCKGYCRSTLNSLVCMYFVFIESQVIYDKNLF